MNRLPRFNKIIIAVLALAALSVLGISCRKRPLRNAALDSQGGQGALGRLKVAREGKLAKKLMVLPYLQGYHKAPAKKNVTLINAKKSFAGYNLFVTGHAARAVLMDMQGRERHAWQYGIAKVWPKTLKAPGATHWRKVYLYENGDLLAIWDGVGMIKLDKDSRLVWSFRETTPEKEHYPHHDMDVARDGTIYVLTRRLEIRQLGDEKPVNIVVDHVAMLSPLGKLLGHVSLLEAFRRYSRGGIYESLFKPGDVFHSNALKVFDGRHQRRSTIFKKGNVLITILKLSMIVIVDIQQQKIVWVLDGKKEGLFDQAHDAVLLDNGNMLVLENEGSSGVDKESKVIEFDPLTRRVVWEYRGTTKKPFYTQTSGTSQRLPNHNTLITDSDSGRAFEVTREGEIVWNFLNPHRTGKKDELIATLPHLHRVSPQRLKWLAASP